MRVTYLRDGYFVVHTSHIQDAKKDGKILSGLGFTYDFWLRYWWTKNPLSALTAAYTRT